MREASSFRGTAMATIFTPIEKACSCYVLPKVPSARALLSVGSVASLTERGKLQHAVVPDRTVPMSHPAWKTIATHLQFQDSEKEK